MQLIKIGKTRDATFRIIMLPLILVRKCKLLDGSWYGGEMKKGIFGLMNYILPQKKIASMHCSANSDLNGKNSTIYFGLSGTGKTTLSNDPNRYLIGDDEHGWDQMDI